MENEVKLKKVDLPMEDLGDRALILVKNKNKILTLNETSKFLWEKCNNKTVNELAQLLHNECINKNEVDFKVVFKDCVAAIDKMIADDLIRIDESDIKLDLIKQKDTLDLTQNFNMNGCYIEVTSRCNLRCLHCYNESGDLHEEISIRAFRNAIDRLDEKEETSVTLSGGEPLLHPQIWDLIEMLQRKKFGNNLLITNATLIDKKIAKKLVDSEISIQISLNGSCEETHDKLCGNGSFHRTMKGIDNLLELNYGDKMIIRCMLSNYNKNDIFPFIKMLVNKGLKHIIIAPLSAVGRSKDNLDDMALGLKEKEDIIQSIKDCQEIIDLKDENIVVQLPKENFSGGCPIVHESDDKITLSPRIDSNGNVFICQMFTDDMYSIGNINLNCLTDIVKSERLSRLIWFARFGAYYIHDCKSCVWQLTCGKGCIAMSLVNGSIQETDGDCYYRKKSLLNSFMNR